MKEFKAKHGHCNATMANNGGDKSFGTWVTKQKRKYCAWKRGETKSLEHALTDEQAALMDELGFGASVEIDGRKLRNMSKPELQKKAMKYSLLNGQLARLVDASAEIEGRSEAVGDAGQQEQQTEQQNTSNAAQDASGNNFDTNAANVANNWGDSANAVSLLVDAIMNKESQAAAPADQAGESVPGSNNGASTWNEV